uniref:Leucine-rich repeat-containing protein 57 n=2 Tax=Lygus hesperus TaxID=30085 RepID=A0A0K8T4V6_LYGHE
MKRTTRKTGVHTGLNDKIGADRRCPIGQLMIGINDQNMSQTKMGPKKIAKKLMQPNQTMGNAALKKHVATAEKTGVLNLSRSKLDEFPEEVMRLKGNLRSLDLAYNKFSSLTPAIGDFSSMKSLVLDHNSLSSLPQEIGKLIKLETLSVVGNKLKTLPNSLENCGNLKQVQLQNNQLKEFPCDVVRIETSRFVGFIHQSGDEYPERGVAPSRHRVEPESKPTGRHSSRNRQSSSPEDVEGAGKLFNDIGYSYCHSHRFVRLYFGCRRESLRHAAVHSSRRLRSVSREVHSRQEEALVIFLVSQSDPGITILNNYSPRISIVIG